MFYTLGIGVHRKYFAALAKQMNQVAPVSASRVEHAHACRDVSSQNLIEYVDINLPELLLNSQSHVASFPAIRISFEQMSARRIITSLMAHQYLWPTMSPA